LCRVKALLFCCYILAQLILSSFPPDQVAASVRWPGRYIGYRSAGSQESSRTQSYLRLHNIQVTHGSSTNIALRLIVQVERGNEGVESSTGQIVDRAVQVCRPGMYLSPQEENKLRKQSCWHQGRNVGLGKGTKTCMRKSLKCLNLKMSRV